MIQKSLIPWNIDYRSSLRIVKRVMKKISKYFYSIPALWSVKITTEFLLEKGKNCNLLLYRSTVCSNPTNNFLMRWIFDVGSKFRKRWSWWGKEGERSGARGTGRGKDKGKNRGEKARKRGKYSYVSRRNPRNLS